MICMKKAICIMLLIIITGFTLIKEQQVKGFSSEENTSSENTSVINLNEELKKNLSKKLIRFHVLANSDSVEDQTLKLKVRDGVLEYISPKLKNSKSINESREILKKEDNEIRKIAQRIIQENGYTYTVNTTLSKENFPVKSYGNITLPQGEYEAYRILIGNGKGQNWWCVMFPPLCFVDVTKAETSKKETEKEMKKVLDDVEYKAVSNLGNSEKDIEDLNTGNNEIKIKFKLLDIFNDIKGKIEKSV